MFAIVLMLMCFVIAVAALVFNVKTLTEGHTTLRLRGGTRIAIDGWLAYLYAINGLIFGAATLCFTVVFGAAGLGPQRWGRVVFPLLGVGGVMFVASAMGAAVITVLLLIRSF